MNWEFVSLDAATSQPWRNGGGVTRELLAWPCGSDWRVRMSVADVRSDGPFSRFAGIERWFAVLEGSGVLLRIEGDRHRLTRTSEPLRFDGDAAVDCSLIDGATRDFNLMAHPGTAGLRRLRGRAEVSTEGSRLLALYAHDSPATIRMDGAATHVRPFHLAWRLADTSVFISIETDDALWMEVAT